MEVTFETWELMSMIDRSYAPPDTVANPDDYMGWWQRDQEAHAQIILMLKGQALNAVLGLATAKECWDKLSVHFKGRGEECIAHLMVDLYHAVFTKSEPMEPQINHLLLTTWTLSTIGYPIKDKVLAFLLILTLSESMATFETNLYSTPKTQLTSKHIMAQILLDKQCYVHLLGDMATAYFAKAEKGGNGQNKDQSKKTEKKCTHCKCKGHDVMECQKLKEKEKAAITTTTLETPSQNVSPPSVTVTATIAAVLVVHSLLDPRHRVQ
jgi:hypothetical protein